MSRKLDALKFIMTFILLGFRHLFNYNMYTAKYRMKNELNKIKSKQLTDKICDERII